MEEKKIVSLPCFACTPFNISLDHFKPMKIDMSMISCGDHLFRANGYCTFSLI